MATNTYKIPQKESKGIFTLLERFLRIDQSVAEVIHVKFLPQIVFVTILSIVYIGNRHYGEKKIRSIHLLEQDVEDLRADYTTLKAAYMFASKQSEVTRRASQLGLQVNKIPPEKVILEE